MARRDDVERRDDLAATSESLQADAERLGQIEEEKRDLDMNDPRLDHLSREAEELGQAVAAKSRIERQLSDGDDRPGPERQGSPN
jgi:hypothetical protein